MKYVVAWIAEVRADTPRAAAEKAWKRVREADPLNGSADTVMHVAAHIDTRVGFPTRDATLIDVSGTELKTAQKPKPLEVDYDE